MADKRINQLPVSSGLTEDSLLVVYQNGVTKSVTGSLIKKFATVGGVYVGNEEPTDDRVLVWITDDDEGDETETPDDGAVDDGTRTPAILGVAVLGRTILGDTSVGEKLATPVIELTTAAVLNAPEIELVEV